MPKLRTKDRPESFCSKISPCSPGSRCTFGLRRASRGKNWQSTYVFCPLRMVELILGHCRSSWRGTDYNTVLTFLCQCTTNYNHYNYNRFTALWLLSRTTQVSRYQKKHSPTHTYRGHQTLSASSIYYDPWHPVQVFFVYLLAWHPPLHTPYISSPNHCHLFAAHAHTITACFAVSVYYKIILKVTKANSLKQS